MNEPLPIHPSHAWIVGMLGDEAERLTEADRRDSRRESRPDSGEQPGDKAGAAHAETARQS